MAYCKVQSRNTNIRIQNDRDKTYFTEISSLRNIFKATAALILRVKKHINKFTFSDLNYIIGIRGMIKK